PQVGQPISCQGVETVTVTSILVRWTASTWTSEMPRSVSQRAQGSVVGASLHPVALVNVEVLGTNGCLVATDHRGPRPLPTLSYPPRVPLPTGSPKSLFDGAGGPPAADVRRRCRTAVEQHRSQPEQWRRERLGPISADRDHGVVDQAARVTVDRRGELVGRGAGGHADLRQVGPHPVSLLLAIAQAGGLFTEPGDLLGVGVGDVLAPAASRGDHEDRIDRDVAGACQMV